MKQSYYRPLVFASILSLATMALVSKGQRPAAQSAVAQDAAPNGPTTVVTEADNGSTVTLSTGEVLIVQLKENPSTGYSRALVSFPNMPIRLVSYQMLPNTPAKSDSAPVVGAPRLYEWRFVATGEAKFDRVVWLKLLSLRPFARGIDGASLWEIKVNVVKTPAS